MEGTEVLPCPFCDYVNADGYFLLQHVELVHPEDGDSPFIVQDEHPDPSPGLHGGFLGESSGRVGAKDHLPPRKESSNHPISNLTSQGLAMPAEYVDCPRNCGESVIRQDLASHMDLHFAENMALDEAAWLPDNNDPPYSGYDEAQKANSLNFSTDLSSHLRNRGHKKEGSGTSSKLSVFKGILLAGSSRDENSARRLGVLGIPHQLLSS